MRMNSRNGPFQDVSMLLLYDWPLGLNVQLWIELCWRFYERIGIEPTMSEYFCADGKTRKIKPKNLDQISRKYSLVGASLTSILPPFDDVNVYSASCHFQISEGGRQKTASFCYVSECIDADLFSGITEEFIELVGPTYGIGLQLPLKKGPTYFASDIIYTTMRERKAATYSSDKKMMQTWINERFAKDDSQLAPMRHTKGMQRDVFPFNILTSVHMERLVDGLTLKEWVFASSERGQLHGISQGCWIWAVLETELPRIREILQSNDVLICI